MAGVRHPRGKHNLRRPFQGPSLIRKTVEEGTCRVIREEDTQYLKSHGIRTDGLTCEPYGMEMDIHYSLNKRRRWQLPEKLRTDFNELQREDVNLRVSVAMHTLFPQHQQTKKQVINWMNKKGGEQTSDRVYHPSFDFYPTTEYHGHIDGEAVHKTSIHGARLKNLTTKPHPKREKNQRKRREKNEEEQKPDYDKEKMFQPVHVRYSILDTDGPTQCMDRKTLEKRCSSTFDRRIRRPVWNNRLFEDDIDDVYEDVDELLVDEDDYCENYPEEGHRVPSMENNLAQFIVQKTTNNKTRSLSPDWSYVEEEFPECPSTSSAPLIPRLVYRPDLPKPSNETSHLYQFTREQKRKFAEERRNLEKPAKDNGLQTSRGEEEPQKLSADDDQHLAVPLKETIAYRGTIPYPPVAGELLKEHPPNAITMFNVYPPTVIVHKAHVKKILGDVFDNCVLIKESIGGEGTTAFILNKCLDCPGYYRRKIVNDYDLVEDVNISPPATITVPTDCPICLNPCSAPFALQCGHVFCVDCWMKHIEAALQNKSVPVKCMDFSCSCLLSLHSSRAILSPESAAVYREIVEEKVLREKFAARCPACHKIQSRDGNQQMECARCGITFCTTCNNSDHRPLSCRALEAYDKLLRQHGLSALTRSGRIHQVEDLTRCPTCQLVVQKVEGCNHIICYRCKENFCFRCGQKWGDGWHNKCTKMPTLDESYLIDHLLSGTTLLGPAKFRVCLSIRAELTIAQRSMSSMLRVLPLEMRKQARVLINTALQTIEFVQVKELIGKSSRRASKKGRAARLQAAFTIFSTTLTNDKDGLAKNYQTLQDFINKALL